MTSRTDLQTRVQEARERFDAAANAMAPDSLESQAICGVWNARDVAGHVADWNDELLAAAEYGLGRTSDAPPMVEDGGAYNASHAEARKGQSWSESKADLDASFDRAASLLAEVEDDQLDSPATFPWGQEGRVGDMIAGAMHHTDEHVVDLENNAAS